jgi:hypothetical protein
MLAKRVVDVDVGGDCAVLLQMTDFDRRGAGNIVDQLQLAGSDGRRRIADGGIVADSALKLQRAAGALDLSYEIHVRGRVPAVLLAQERLDQDLGNDADEEGFAGTDAQKLSDCRAHRHLIAARYFREPDRDLRAPDRDYLADRGASRNGQRLVLAADELGIQHRYLKRDIRGHHPL